MNRLVYICLVLLGCMGCSNWLDVSPRTEVKEGELYKTEDGFKSVLMGAYVQMASADLYGKNVTIYFPELLSRTWTIPEDDSRPVERYAPAWDFKHATVEQQVERIYKSYYKCIAHLNNVLGNMDGNEGVFANGNYDLIKGEALGLRAFLHLDLLRFFGPVPNGDAQGKPAIPYVEEMTLKPDLLVTLTYGEVVERIVRDLDAAEKLLENDPLVVSENKQLNDPWREQWEEKPLDDWHFNRQVRFNYYAVKGTKARLYHWTGDKEQAVKYAKEVIESKKFRLTNEYDYLGDYNGYRQNMVMLSEHLFGVQNPDHQNVILPLFKSSEAELGQTADKISEAYEGIAGDIRNVKNRYWEEKSYGLSKKVNHFRKYSGTDEIPAYNTIPLLRLAEMYFILLEDLPEGGHGVYYTEYLLARNLPSDWGEQLDAELTERLEKEYRKEFMGEGQMFFFYKKHAYPEFTWPVKFKVPDLEYRIPLPQSQTVFD